MPTNIKFKSYSFLMSVFSIMIFTAMTSSAQTNPVAPTSLAISAINNDYEKATTEPGLSFNDYERLNNKFRTWLNIPYYFSLPYSSFLNLPEEITSNRTSDDSSPLVLFHYRETNTNNKSDQQTLGLRLIAVNDTDSRIKNSERLAQSGLIQTGDIILSARPEWFGTLVYSHVQLGVSHAGIALVKNGKVYSIDMPLNDEMMGNGGTLTSDHYKDTKMLHILRYKNLTDEQRNNIAQWLEIFLEKRASIYKIKSQPDAVETYKNKITFNMNYGAPNFDRTTQDLSFVGDLGRLALGMDIKGLTMFCSEFVWSILSMRDCNPIAQKNDFKTISTPSCISKAFQPMPVFGNLYESNISEEQQIGMTDGPSILADIMGTEEMSQKARKNLMNESVFRSAKGKREGLSQGHKMIEAMLLKAMPNLYEMIKTYFNLTRESDPVSVAARNQIRMGFNLSQKLNYSPTSFMMHAMVPNTFKGQPVTAKKIDYVGTIVFLKPVTVNYVMTDAYQTLKEIPKQIQSQPKNP